MLTNTAARFRHNYRVSHLAAAEDPEPITPCDCLEIDRFSTGAWPKLASEGVPGGQARPAYGAAARDFRQKLSGGGAGAVQDAGGGAAVHVEGDADGGGAGASGDVGGGGGATRHRGVV